MTAIPANHRRLPTHGPSPTNQWVDEQTGLVDQDEVGLLSPDSFLLTVPEFGEGETVNGRAADCGTKEAMIHLCVIPSSTEVDHGPPLFYYLPAQQQ